MIGKCSICGEPMPEGETMFKFHGYSGPCPKPPLKKVKDLQGKIASGEISPEAPCDGMYSEWSKSQTERLKTALAGVFSWK